MMQCEQVSEARPSPAPSAAASPSSLRAARAFSPSPPGWSGRRTSESPSCRRNTNPLSDDSLHAHDPRYQRLAASLARRAAEADEADAPLFMLQQAEYSLIDAGRIDPSKGERLVAFGPDGEGGFVCDIRGPSVQ